MKNSKSIKSLVAILLLLPAAFFWGCDGGNDIGDDLEDAADETGDAMEDAADNAGDALDEAGDEIRDATN